MAKTSETDRSSDAECKRNRDRRSTKPTEIFTISSDNRITIAGMTGTGKTTLARFILKKFSSVLVWDPLGQYNDFNHYIPQTGKLDEFEYVCKNVWQRGNVLLAIEEAEQVLGERLSWSDHAYKIVNMGRNRGIGLMAITRRIAELKKTVFGLSDHVYLYKFFAPNDVDYVKSFLGREWANRLRNLPQYHFIYYGGGENIRECEPISI